MRRLRAADVLALAGLAWVGDLVGHWLAYVLAVPNVTARDALLLATGHEVYWHAGVATAVVLGTVSLAVFLGRSLLRGFRSDGGGWPELGGWRQTACGLAPLQAAIFVVQETLERLLVHAPLSTLFVGHVLALGIVLQLVIGCMLALVLTGLGRAAEAVGVALRGKRRPVAACCVAPQPLAAPAVRSSQYRPQLPRGPPALA